MKIGLVTPYVYPLPGGVNEHVRYLYAGLRSRGHDVRIISSSHGLQRSSEGDVIRLGKGFSMPANGSVGTITLSPRYLSQVGAMLERESFDLLHFHEPFVPFLSPIVLRASNSVNIATFHAFGGWSPAYQFGSRAMRGYADRLHGRIAVSAAARHFIDRFFPGDYKVIPNGVDVARFRDAVPIARWQDGVSNILFVGRHEPRKGLLDLLKAHRILRKTGCNCRLLIVGTGPQEREARRYVLTRRMSGVEFLGRVSDEEKAQLFRTADVYVSPATGGESFGIVLLEAMAAGAPIVASDIHGYKGVVKRGEQGLLVPPRKPKAIAAAVGELLADPALRAQMSASGRARAEEFSWARVTAKVEAYYGFVIRRLAAGGALPPDFHAPVPPPPPRTSLAAGAAASVGGAAAAATISAIAEAQLEDVAEA
jgi:phosphatidylinositol alpha-mannosyltransferase